MVKENGEINITIPVKAIAEAFQKYLENEDVIHVVRCKDCRWREREQPGMVYCPNTVGNWVEDDWYCADGERRKDE